MRPGVCWTLSYEQAPRSARILRKAKPLRVEQILLANIQLPATKRARPDSSCGFSRRELCRDRKT